MNKVNEFIKQSILIILIILISLPVLNGEIKIIQEKKLHGAIKQAPKPELNFKDYFKGVYQEEYAEYLNDHLQYRSYLISIYNQILYSFFRIANAKGVIIGKENYMYEDVYIHEYTGKTFIGDSAVNTRVRALEEIDSALQSKGKYLIVVLAPGKASFFPEYIPDNYPIVNKQTNYKSYHKHLSSSKVPHIDFSDLFRKYKEISEYPLYGKYGIHWSVYGMHKAADSLIRFTEQLLNKNIPEKRWLGIELSDTARFEDNDIEKGLNIYSKLKAYPLAYPIVDFESSEESYRPNLLAISDSYWWTIHGAQIPHNQFGDYKFLFYYNAAYDGYNEISNTVSKDLLYAYIEDAEVIVLMATDANLSWFPYGFIEDATDILIHNYVPEAKIPSEIMDEIKVEIRNSKEWMEDIKRKAVQNKLSIEEQIHADALWMYNKRNEK